MRTFLSFCLRKSCRVFAPFILLLGYTPGASAAMYPMQSIISPYPTSVALALPLEKSDFGSFVGNWYAHGAGMSFDSSGRAHFEERVYRWCGQGVAQPCDSTNGNQIINGHREDLQFSRVADSVAYGVVVSSNFHPVGLSVTLTLLPGDRVLYSAGTTMAGILCGPDAEVGACGA
jgi:hypothetical protein